MKLTKKSLVIYSIIFVFAVLFFLSSFGRTAFKSFLFTTEVIKDFPIKPLSFFGPNVVKENINIETGEGIVRGNVYRPDKDGKFPAVIFSLGITPEGLEDNLLNTVGRSLAKIGIVTVAAEIFDSEFTEVQDIDDLKLTFKKTRNLDFVDKENIGFVGFCLGGSFSVIAAADEELSDEVDFIVLISPYFDNFKTIEAVATGKTEIGKKVVNWSPNVLSEKVFLNGYTRYISKFISEEDAEIIRESAEKNTLLSQEELDTLAEGSRAMYETLTANSVEEFRDSIERYPVSEIKALEDTSPKNFVNGISNSTKIFTLSDAQDSYVPRSETLAFKDAFPNGTFVEIDSFQHVRPGTSLPRLAAFTQSAIVFSFVNGIMQTVFEN